MQRTIPDSVLILSQFYWPEEIGSAPYVTDLAEWLAGRGVSVTVLTARPHYPEYRVRPGYKGGDQTRTRRNGVDIVRMRTPVLLGGGVAGRIALESMLTIQAIAYLASGRVKRRSRVISFCPSVLLVMAGQVATRSRGRHLAIIHDIQSGLADGLGMISSRALKRLMVATERVIFNRTTRLAVLTEAMRYTLQGQGIKRPIDILPIWVDVDEIHPLPPPASPSHDVLYAGNLGRKQGLEQVIGAAEVLATEAPEVRILIRGEGPRRKELEDRAGQLGLTNVTFDDLVPKEQLNECLASAAVHLVPQSPDGADFAVPSKAYAIMAAGRPFIATAAPGTSLANLQEQTRAFECVSPNDREAFAAAIRRLVRSPEDGKKLGDQGRAFVVGHLSRETILKQMLEFLAQTGSAS